MKIKQERVGEKISVVLPRQHCKQLDALRLQPHVRRSRSLYVAMLIEEHIRTQTKAAWLSPSRRVAHLQAPRPTAAGGVASPCDPDPPPAQFQERNEKK
jgi:hypothetical protein